MGVAGRCVVSIYGPAGSGKSGLAKAVAARVGPDRCVRVPTDYFLVPVDDPLAHAFVRSLAYDWALLGRLLALPEGTATSTPDFDFERLRRLATTGGRLVVLRRVMVTDAMEPYPTSDVRVLLTAPPHIRWERIGTRDRAWNSRIRDRWGSLEATWTRVRSLAPIPDLELDGTRALVGNASHLVAWLAQQIGDGTMDAPGGDN